MNRKRVPTTESIDLMTFAMCLKILMMMEEVKTEMIDKKYYDSREIAELTGMSVWWVVKWRRQIVGARQYGREWRFDRALVDRRIAAGKDIRDKI